MEVLQVGEYVILTFLLDSLQHLPFIHHKCWEVEEGAASRREYNAGISVGTAFSISPHPPVPYWVYRGSTSQIMSLWIAFCMQEAPGT